MSETSKQPVAVARRKPALSAPAGLPAAPASKAPQAADNPRAGASARALLFGAALACAGPGHAADNDGLVLPDGFSATVFHEGVGPARHLAVRDNGDVYVMTMTRASEAGEQDQRGIVALRDTDGDGAADEVRSFSGIQGTGIGFHDGMLYVSDRVTVWRYALDDDRLVPDGEPEVVVEGFPPERQHADKPFAFDGEGNLYVNIGAPSNACQETDRTPGSPGMQPCPLLESYAGIWRFSAGTPGQQPSDGERYAAGLRNSNALEWHDASGALYVVMHGRDQLDAMYPDLFDAQDNAERVAEEMFRIEPGREHGWPYTYYDVIDGRRVLAPEYGGDGEKTPETGAYPEPVVAFPAHWAPNDLVFYGAEQFPEEYRGGAFIAFHGSWNRAPEPQAGFNVAFVPLNPEGAPAGEWRIFADGFAAGEVLSPTQARARPVGLAVGPDGDLYVSDSLEGRIWRIRYGGGT